MTKKGKSGRPKISLTDEQLAQTQALATVMTVDQIADYFGIGRTTFYRIMDRDAGVMERYKKGRAMAIANIGRSLYQKALDGDTTSIIFFLKTQAGWRETNNLNLSNDDGSMNPKNQSILDEVMALHEANSKK